MSSDIQRKIKKAEETRKKLAEELQYVESIEEELQKDSEKQQIADIRKKL